MSAPSATPSLSKAKLKPSLPHVPPLENGDCLTRAEFERRLEAMPEGARAQLIEGVVHMPAATRFVQHGQPHFQLSFWVSHYTLYTLHVKGGLTSSVRLDDINEPEPDVVLFIEPGCGGQAFVDAEGYIAGSPELAAEIAASSVSIDLNAKFRAYRRNGVKEYIVWRTLDEEIDWFILRGEQYERLAPDANGILRSEVFLGLWLDPAALIRGDMVRVHEVLVQGLAEPAHAAFVAKLKEAR